MSAHDNQRTSGTRIGERLGTERWSRRTAANLRRQDPAVKGVHAHGHAVQTPNEQVAIGLPDYEIADEVVRYERLNYRIVGEGAVLSGKGRIVGVVCVPETNQS